MLNGTLQASPIGPASRIAQRAARSFAAVRPASARCPPAVLPSGCVRVKQIATAVVHGGRARPHAILHVLGPCLAIGMRV